MFSSKIEISHYSNYSKDKHRLILQMVGQKR